MAEQETVKRVRRSVRGATGDGGARLALGAVAAAGVAGAAAAGKRGLEAISRDGSNGDSGGGRSRAYRLKKGETLGDGLRRIALGRMDHALEALRDPGANRAEAVHEARKDLKKVRAVLRLVRDRIGDDLYRAENAHYRDAGRSLSGARDAQVKLETLDELGERFADELAYQRVAGFRERLEAERRHEAEGQGEEIGTAAADEIESGRKRIPQWPIEGDEWGIVEGGLKRAYRRGRNRFGEVLDEPSVENLHEWRKRVKDLWYALRILSPAWKEAVKPLADHAHALSDLLGDDHDLAVLAAAARQHSAAFEEPENLHRVLETIGRRRAELQGDAVSLGRRLYADKPGAFVGRIEAWWRAWRVDAGTVAAA
jgi:CHAD domain-containing protein